METKVVNSWSLVAFAKTHGKMKVAPFINKETGELFKSCMFVDAEGNINKVVNFSSKLGELTPQQIVAQKDELQVIELNTGKYKLCKSGSTWEDVDLGI